MSPTIVTKDGKTFMVIGSPGGSRIITITLETMMNVIDYGMDLQEAVDAPRIHHQWLPDEIFVEPMALSPDTRKMLDRHGLQDHRAGALGRGRGDHGDARRGATGGARGAPKARQILPPARE